MFNKKPKLSVITVNWNGLEYLKKCVDAIQEFTTDYELIIVDNNSEDGSKHYIAELLKKNNNIKSISIDYNAGWVEGINIGLGVVKGEYICFLNNDIEVKKNWFVDMAKHFDDPDGEKVGAVGCTTNFTMGLQRADLTKLIKGNHHKVNYLIGWLILTKRKILEEVAKKDNKGEPRINGMAGLDTRFGIGSSDDLDISLRFVEAGYSLFVAREVFVYHHGSKSFVKMFGDQLMVKGTEDNKAYMADVDKKLDILREKWGKDRIKKLLTIAMPQPTFKGTIGVPHQEFFPHRWHTDFISLKGLEDVKVSHVYGSQVAKARNDIVKSMSGEWLVFIDSDMTFPSDSLQRLLEDAKREDVDIVGAPCYRKVAKYEPCWFWQFPNDKEKYYRKLETDLGEELFEVDSMGSAFCLIKKKVFEKLEEVENKRKKQAQEKLDKLLKDEVKDEIKIKEARQEAEKNIPHYQYTDTLSEDILFCRKAKELGFKIWIDPKLQIGHLTMLPIDKRVFEGYNKIEILEWKKKRDEFGEDPTIHAIKEKAKKDKEEKDAKDLKQKQENTIKE